MRAHSTGVQFRQRSNDLGEPERPPALVAQPPRRLEHLPLYRFVARQGRSRCPLPPWSILSARPTCLRRQLERLGPVRLQPERAPRSRGFCSLRRYGYAGAFRFRQVRAASGRRLVSCYRLYMSSDNSPSRGSVSVSPTVPAAAFAQAPERRVRRVDDVWLDAGVQVREAIDEAVVDDHAERFGRACPGFLLWSSSATARGTVLPTASIGSRPVVARLATRPRTDGMLTRVRYPAGP